MAKHSVVQENYWQTSANELAVLVFVNLQIGDCQADAIDSVIVIIYFARVHNSNNNSEQKVGEWSQ